MLVKLIKNNIYRSIVENTLRIYDSQQLEKEPLCCLQLPSVIPPSFHGTWQEKSEKVLVNSF